MADFFISYTQADRNWAEWVGYVLEAKGFKIIIQAWDFRPGSNFVLEMNRAAEVAKRTILILSPDYLKSDFAASEWAAAYVNDPRGLERKVVPVMVRACEPQGLLETIVQIRLIGLGEDKAQTELLEGVENKRAKPSTKPIYPPNMTITPPEQFPGGGSSKLPLIVASDTFHDRGEPITINLTDRPNNVLDNTLPGLNNGLIDRISIIIGKKKLVGMTTAVVIGAGGLGIIIASLGGARYLCGITNSCAVVPVPALPSYDSDWIDGGSDPNKQCEPLRAKYASQNPSFNITFQSSEENKRDFLQHVTYRYHCHYIATRK